MGEYLECVNNDPTLDASYKANVAAALASIDASIVADLAKMDDVVAGVNADLTAAVAVSNAASEDDTDEVYENYVPEYKSALGDVNSIVKETYELPTYETDTNKIVYERYSDGTVFVLNFNNYKVIVDVDGHSYAIDAYGYVVLPKQQNQ